MKAKCMQMNILSWFDPDGQVFGVRALAGVLSRKFRVAAEFVDLRVPF